MWSACSFYVHAFIFVFDARWASSIEVVPYIIYKVSFQEECFQVGDNVTPRKMIGYNFSSLGGLV